MRVPGSNTSVNSMRVRFTPPGAGWDLLASIGATGQTGATGPQGIPGSPGADGATGPTGPEGPTGATGATGAVGPQGPAGPIGPAGKDGKDGTDGKGFTFQGIFSPTTLYHTNDVVQFNGSSYIATVDNLNGVIPPETGWQLLASAGAVGPQGPAGADGAQGPMGLTGPTGADGAVGPTGPEGPQGPIGLTGPTGPGGPQGPAGAPGSGRRVYDANGIALGDFISQTNAGAQIGVMGGDNNIYWINFFGNRVGQVWYTQANCQGTPFNANPVADVNTVQVVGIAGNLRYYRTVNAPLATRTALSLSFFGIACSNANSSISNTQQLVAFTPSNGSLSFPVAVPVTIQ
jgi:hypothetical protein